MQSNLVLKLSNAEEYSIDVDLNVKVAEFKKFAASIIGIEPSQQQVIFRGKVLKDGRTLLEYGLRKGSKIHISCVPEPPRTSFEGSSDSSSFLSDMELYVSLCYPTQTNQSSWIEFYQHRFTPSSSFNLTIGIHLWLCAHANVMAVAVGHELNILYLDFQSLCEMAKVEYISEKLAAGSVRCDRGIVGSVTYRQRALQDANWLGKHLVVSYLLDRLEVSQQPQPADLETEQSPYQLCFVPQAGDKEGRNLIIMDEIDFAGVLPPSHKNSPREAVFLDRYSHSTYCLAINSARDEQTTLLEALREVLPSTSSSIEHRTRYPLVTPSRSTLSCLGGSGDSSDNEPGLSSLASTVSQTGPDRSGIRVIDAEPLDSSIHDCLTCNLRISFRQKYLNHLRHFILAAAANDGKSTTSAMSKDEIFKRMNLFRGAMNSTEHTGIYGKLIVSDDVLTESVEYSPAQALRWRYNERYRKMMANSTSPTHSSSPARMSVCLL